MEHGIVGRRLVRGSSLLGLALAAALALPLVSAPQASAAISTQASGFGLGIPGSTVGGFGDTFARVVDTATVVNPDHDQIQSINVFGSLTVGSEGLDLRSTGIVSAGAPQRRLTGFAGGTADMQDDFLIGPGTSGLAAGTPVQVTLHAQLRGKIELGGAPSGTSFASFVVLNLGGSPIRPVDWNTAGLNPPQSIDVDERFAVVLETIIGATLTVRSILDADLNATAVDPGDTVTNVIDLDSLVRVSFAPGFEDIEITSAAGAPTIPPQVPLLGSWMLVVLVAAMLLCSLGVMARRGAGKLGSAT